MNSNTSTAHTASKQPGLLRNRNFALLWIGRTISVLGDYAFDTTLILWIGVIIAKGQSWAPLAVSGVLIATSIPIFLIGPIAGVFVDRWEKRPTMLWMDALRAILITLLLFAANLFPLPFFPDGKMPASWQLGMIYAIVFLASTCAQFFNPSRMALIGDLVPEPQRAQASGLTQISMSIAGIIGPPLAAPVLFAFGVEWALIVNALSFVASFVAILAIQAPKAARSIQPGEQSSFFREFADGIRFFVGNRVLVTLLITIMIVMLGAGAINALGVFFMTENLHTSASFFGLVDAVMGIGIIAGAILASAFAQRLGVARTFWFCTVGAGIVFLVFARMSLLLPALVLMLLLGVMQAGLNVAVNPLILHVTPRELVGRISSVLDPATSLVSIVSIAIAGSLASTVLNNLHATVLGMTFGPIDTIFAFSGLLILLGGLYAMVNLRDVRLAKEEENISAEAAEAEAASVPASMQESASAAVAAE
ncbi:MAG TPA: MFS transporter [Ktedonobacterales bacterium]|jgi:MFS family permease